MLRIYGPHSKRKYRPYIVSEIWFDLMKIVTIILNQVITVSSVVITCISGLSDCCVHSYRVT